MSTNKPPRGFTTAILHSDRAAGIEHGALHKPLHLSVAYGYRDARDLAAVFQGRAQGYAYGRQGNPTTAALEAKVTQMEDGVATVCFATGMAAIGAMMLALLREGDHVVSSQFLFGNTVSQFGTLAAHGTQVTYVDATDVANVERALTPATRLIFVETIANPRTQVADLARIGALARERGILYVVDNTMTSPALFRPKAVGAGLVVNALTKYIGGSRQRARRQHHRHRPLRLDALSEHRGELQVAAAGALGHPAAAQEGVARLGRDAGRGRRAPHRRRRRDARAADGAHLRERAGARRRSSRRIPKVRAVYYPGLASHPQHALARSLFCGCGGLFAFELADGIDCFDFLNRLDIVVSSSNLGDNRTLAIPVAHTIFWEMGAERRAAMGIADALIRVSVGIEDRDDLLGDFTQALG